MLNIRCVQPNASNFYCYLMAFIMMSISVGFEHLVALIGPVRKRRKLCAAAIALFIVFYLLYTQTVVEVPIASGHFNYFPRTSYEEYLVSTPNCRIPNISSPDPAILSLLGPKVAPVDCREKGKRWTYLDDSMQVIILNFTAMREAGYTPGSVQCCYQAIRRFWGSDTKFRLSSTCVPLNSERTRLDVELIRVKCVSKYWPFFWDVVYRDHHALVQPEKNSAVKRKIEQWKVVEEAQRPPSVVILGLDSISRLNFHRMMPKTRKILEQLGAVELLGYTKVGENTFPNAVPFLSGYSVQQLAEICYSPDRPQDGCPYAWNWFNSLGYLTVHLEDNPRMSIFNYLKVGFATPQADFYLRPLMLSAYRWQYNIDCIGAENVTTKMLRYTRGLINAAQRHGTPQFTVSWITSLAHDNPHAPSFADGMLVEFLRLTNLNRTLLFFMSDHGYRFGKYRRTDVGWYEDKLPAFWVYLSPDLQQHRADWLANLKLNSRRLTSPYDLYHTMVHIVTNFTNSSAPGDSWSRDGTVARRRYGQSLFTEVPQNRTCRDAGIGNEHCACRIPMRVDDLKNAGLLRAATAGVNFLNDRVPPQCARFKLKEITAGASTAADGTAYSSSSWLYYVIFTVEPGEFPFEAAVEYDKVLDSYTVDRDIHRLNRISRSVACVSESELEPLCYCL